MSFLASYAAFMHGARVAVLTLAIVIAVLAIVDWIVRTRRISPFSRVARFFRGNVDPILAPIERVIVRQGGVPSNTAWWGLVLFVVAALGFLWLLSFVGGLIQSAIFMAQEPLNEAWRTPVSWAFGFFQIALLVRVISTWLPISPHSPWIRWSYACTEWLLRPLRRVIPMVGMLDITPIIAWFLLGIIEKLILS